VPTLSPSIGRIPSVITTSGLTLTFASSQSFWLQDELRVSGGSVPFAAVPPFSQHQKEPGGAHLASECEVTAGTWPCAFVTLMCRCDSFDESAPASVRISTSDSCAGYPTQRKR
jgi:hypothetical protein